jgi:hypothetical protein
MFQWFNRVKVAHKLSLIAIFFMVPDTVLLCLFLYSCIGLEPAARAERHRHLISR